MTKKQIINTVINMKNMVKLLLNMVTKIKPDFIFSWEILKKIKSKHCFKTVAIYLKLKS